MKKTIIIATLAGFFTACTSSSSSEQTLESIKSEYQSFGAESFATSMEELEQKIFELRDEAIKSGDTMTVLSLDSILLEGKAAPEYTQETALVDSLIESTEVRKCGAVDNAPANVARLKTNSMRLPVSPIEIPVYFHVIQSDAGDGFLSEATLKSQIDVLNETFQSTLFSFSLAGIDSTRNENWYYRVDQGTIEERDMYRALAINPLRSLNVFLAGNASYLGYANFPWDSKKNFDGVVVLNTTLPGGSAANYNQGKTLTHEVGHYLGLWHTFHKGCDVGDNVSDTPDEAVPTNGCPVGKDTCPTPGEDPITNYMDYSYDACMTQFTSGQNSRMNWAVRKYRKELVPLYQ